MRVVLFAGLFSFLASCGINAEFFDGRRICLDNSKYHISSDRRITGIPWIGEGDLNSFDEEGPGDGILRVTYRSGDKLYEKFVDSFGSQENGYELISYSIWLLDQEAKVSYTNHSKIFDAYHIRGEYSNASVVRLPGGLKKVIREDHANTWELFGSDEPVGANPLSLWYGTCSKGAPLGAKINPVKCSFFDFYRSNYLLSVSVPENYAPYRNQIIEFIYEDLDENVFCEQGNGL